MKIRRDPSNELGIIVDLTDEFVDYRRAQVDLMLEYLQRFARTSKGRVTVAAALRSLFWKAKREAAAA